MGPIKHRLEVTKLEPVFVILRACHQIIIKFRRDFPTKHLLVAKGISGKGHRATATQVPVFFNLEGVAP